MGLDALARPDTHTRASKRGARASRGRRVKSGDSGDGDSESSDSEGIDDDKLQAMKVCVWLCEKELRERKKE